MRMPLEDLVEQIAAGALHIQIGKTFQLDGLMKSLRCTAAWRRTKQAEELWR
jgi:hypothetical protein